MRRPDGVVVDPGLPLPASVVQPFPPGVVASNKDAVWCRAHVDAPLTFLPAHTSPLAIAFSSERATALPLKYQGGAFVALHGSWNRDPATGYSVVYLPRGAPMPTSTPEATRYAHEVVFGSPRGDGPWGWSEAGGAGEDPVRPAGLALGPDGALYVSSDNHATSSRGIRRPRGALYRVSAE